MATWGDPRLVPEILVFCPDGGNTIAWRAEWRLVGLESKEGPGATFHLTPLAANEPENVRLS